MNEKTYCNKNAMRLLLERTTAEWGISARHEMHQLRSEGHSSNIADTYRVNGRKIGEVCGDFEGMGKSWSGRSAAQETCEGLA